MTATIKDIMCTSPTWLPSDATVQDAAQKMKELDCGFIPVGSGNKLQGIVTDRDITIRATAQGLSPLTPVSEIMSGKVLYCFETDRTSDVARNMADNQIRRLIVLDNSTSKKLVGVVSVCDIVTANKTEASTSSELIKCVSKPSNNSASANKKSKAA